MLYDSYVNQVKKAARIKDKIIKYKLHIFIVIGAIFAFLIFFVLTKGIVLSDVNATSQSITYGENPDVGVSSLLKGHHIECTSFIYDDVSLNTTSVKPDLKYTYIYNESGLYLVKLTTKKI